MFTNEYPGMMVREERRLLENLKFIDLVVEVADARIPRSSRNRKFQKMLGEKKRIIILNKADLADQDITGRWLNHLAGEKRPVLAFDAKKTIGLKKLEKVLLMSRPANLKYKRSLRLMVVGIPNVGKSTIINRLVHKFAVKIGEKPGITKGPQWIRLRSGWEMMDTPGLLSPNIKRNDNLLKLAAIGSLNLPAFDEENTAQWLVELILSREKTSVPFMAYYSLEKNDDVGDTGDFLKEIGLRRGCLTKGGEVDKKKAARIILKDFRRGALGRISLEEPGDDHEDI
ncbi:MAG: ribosome biogenesis GTPase YlqF [Bacillota bacterium]|nr:ribosome biogenesis GTPase YlqF [Bacillota bacterium]